MGSQRHSVVVVGGGFGGLNVTRALAPVDVEVTVVDRTTTTCFSLCCTRWRRGFCHPG
jgi:NADH:quinone reductase (non-electrogenic)